MIEEKSFDVTLTIKLRTRIDFAPAERNRVLVRLDAISNAMGLINRDTLEQLEDEFYLELITGEATEID